MLLTSLFAVSAIAQGNKIPAETRLYLQTIEASNNRAPARGIDGQFKQREAKLFLSCSSEADTKDVEAQLMAIGVKPQGTIGRFIMVSTPVSKMEQIAAIDGITYISKGPKANQKTLISREVSGVSETLDGINLPQAYTGQGVVVGIIDLGFDFHHPSFKDVNGNLRIKSFYAANFSPQTRDKSVITLDGTELGGSAYTNPEEILALKCDSKSMSHGSHCAATAAGSSFAWAGGMAPEADIVLCSLTYLPDTEDMTPDLFNDLDETYLVIQSILYIRDYARRQGKPCVISMSLNSHDGPHDGTSTASSLVNRLALEGTNMTLAASNEGLDDLYMNHTFGANDTLHSIVGSTIEAYAFTRTPGEMSFQIGLYDKATETEVWRSLPLRSDNDGCSFEIDFSDANAGPPSTDPQQDIINHLAGLITGKFHFCIDKLEDGRAHMALKCNSRPLDYKYVIHIACAQNSIVDVWGDYGTNFTAKNGSNYYTQGNSTKSMGDWGTGGNIVTVGAWVSKTSFVNILGETNVGYKVEIGQGVGSYAPFSSYGTDLLGNDHPFVSTPGVRVVSALNHHDPTYGLTTGTDVVAMNAGFSWGAMSGTSMSTPTAAGIIALWLQAKPDLTYDEIKQTIAATSTTDAFTQANPIRFGHGKMDAYKGLLHILDFTAIPEISSWQPEDVTFRIGDDRLFIDGAEDGTLIRMYSTDGILVLSAPLTGGCVNLPAATGVYAVQVGTLGSTLIRK